MSNNPYLYEKLVATRQAEIHHAMQQSHRPAHSEQTTTFVERVTGRFGSLLVELGSRLQRTEQQRGAILAHEGGTYCCTSSLRKNQPPE